MKRLFVILFVFSAVLASAEKIRYENIPWDTPLEQIKTYFPESDYFFFEYEDEFRISPRKENIYYRNMLQVNSIYILIDKEKNKIKQQDVCFAEELPISSILINLLKLMIVHKAQVVGYYSDIDIIPYYKYVLNYLLVINDADARFAVHGDGEVDTPYMLDAHFYAPDNKVIVYKNASN